MFTFRLKHEFQDHKLTSLIWLGTLFLLLLTIYLSWNRPLDFDYQNDGAIGFIFLGNLIASIVHTHQVLGRDLYLQHTAFWNTRPIRGNTLFKVKWVYLQLSITLPTIITVALLTLIIGRPDQLLRGALEYGVISLMITSALTYSMLAMRRGRYLALVVFGATLFIPLIAIANIFPRVAQRQYDFNGQINGTPFLIVSILTLGFIAFLFLTLRKRHQAPAPLIVLPAIALLTVTLIIFQPLRWERSEIIKTSTLSVDKSITDQKIYWNKAYQGEQNRLIFNQHFPIGESEWDATQPSKVMSVNLHLLEVPENVADRVIITASAPQSGVAPRIQISCSFCSTKPIGNRHRSGSGSLAESHPVHSLPADTPVTISGSIIVSQNSYQELVNASINNEDTQSSGPLRYRIRRSLRSETGFEMKLQHGHLLTFFTFDPYRHSQIESTITHPPTGVKFDNNGGFSSGGPLGTVHQHDYRIWKNAKFRESGFTKQEISNQAVIQIANPTEQIYYEIPIEFKTMIPDPQKILELLD